jgi:hypothetical protein
MPVFGVQKDSKFELGPNDKVGWFEFATEEKAAEAAAMYEHTFENGACSAA